jgi:hypothetical protein
MFTRPPAPPDPWYAVSEAGGNMERVGALAGWPVMGDTQFSGAGPGLSDRTGWKGCELKECPCSTGGLIPLPL